MQTAVRKRAADFDFWGDTPTPEFCENSHERGAAVSCRYSPRIRSPLGGTPERGGRGASGLRRNQAGGGALAAVCPGGRGAGAFRRGGAGKAQCRAAAGASGARRAGAFLPGGGGKPGAGGLGRVRRTKAAWRARRRGAGTWPGSAARAVFGAFRGGRGEGAAGSGRGAARPGRLPVAGVRRAAARAKRLHPARLV